MEIIVGLILLFFIFEIIIGILKFMWDNKETIIGIAVIFGIIFLIANMEKPLSFFAEWFQNTKLFLWNMTYQHTLIDTLWIYSAIIVVALFVSSGIEKLISSDFICTIVCSFVGLGASGCSFIINENVGSFFLIAITIFMIAVLWIFRKKAKERTGYVKDVKIIFGNICSSSLFYSLLVFLSCTGLIERANKYFEVKVSDNLVPIIFGCFTGCFVFSEYKLIFKGYKYIARYVKDTPFFSLKDFHDNKELAYLNDPEEYYHSVIRNMIEQKKIYRLPISMGWFINYKMKKEFEKCIKANMSSETIKSKIKANYRIFKFEEIYMAMFELIKDYKIDFTESNEAISRKNSGIGIGATEFVLMRYPIEEHPILDENEEIRKEYVTALNSLVQCFNLEADKWKAKLEEFIEEFKVDGLSENTEAAIEKFSDNITKKVGLFRTQKTDYSYVLLLESIYFRNLLTKEAISYQEIEKIFETLKIKKDYRDFIYQYIKSMYIDGDTEKAEKLIQSNIKTSIQKVLHYIHYNIMWNEKYVDTKQYHVAVCATMSAGKSTFINSMLGTDYIPAKNEACTAKVTTIRDNDNLKKLIGCYTRIDGSKEYSNMIDGKLLQTWNDDNEVVQTVLEGEIEEVSCESKVLVIHDTPGTNNSEDTTHHDKTIDFLKNTSLNLVMYLINAEYISTNDTEELLEEIKEIIKGTNTQIVFGVNKIDAYDEENESIGTAIEGLRQQLKTYGFEQPIIFPFSANAARLFKMALKDFSMSKRERRTFDGLLEKFTSFSASDYIVNAETSNNSIHYPKRTKDKKIIINDIEYSYNAIVLALQNTGVLNVENWLESQMSLN